MMDHNRFRTFTVICYPVSSVGVAGRDLRSIGVSWVKGHGTSCIRDETNYLYFETSQVPGQRRSP